MVLDIVEFVMAVEETFDIEVTDEDAQDLGTPRELIAFVSSRVPTRASGPCISQHTFYRLRDVISRQARVPRAALRPDTQLSDVIPDDPRSIVWLSIQHDLAVQDWPPRPGSWRFTWLSQPPADLRQLTKHLVCEEYRSCLGPDGEWTDAQIREITVRLIEEQFGLDMMDYTLDATFVDDMGVQ